MIQIILGSTNLGVSAWNPQQWLTFCGKLSVSLKLGNEGKGMQIKPIIR